jgi:hypothetical protein
MMTQTPIITKVEEIGQGAIPILGGAPKSLRIACQTVDGPFYVSITETAALELTAVLTHMFVNGRWETTP